MILTQHIKRNSILIVLRCKKNKNIQKLWVKQWKIVIFVSIVWQIGVIILVQAKQVMNLVLQQHSNGQSYQSSSLIELYLPDQASFEPCQWLLHDHLNTIHQYTISLNDASTYLVFITSLVNLILVSILKTYVFTTEGNPSWFMTNIEGPHILALILSNKNKACNQCPLRESVLFSNA